MGKAMRYYEEASLNGEGPARYSAASALVSTLLLLAHAPLCLLVPTLSLKLAQWYEAGTPFAARNLHTAIGYYHVAALDRRTETEAVDALKRLGVKPADIGQCKAGECFFVCSVFTSNPPFLFFLVFACDVA
jgi:hypothetical protein